MKLCLLFGWTIVIFFNVCVSPTTAQEDVIDIDMRQVRARLIQKEGWSLQHADYTIKQYRRFWYLHKKYPQVEVVPSIDVDEVWHAHILYTRDYISDCNRIFGEYFHHMPTPITLDNSDLPSPPSTSSSPSPSPSMDSDRNSVLFRRTLTLYQKEFDETPGPEWIGRGTPLKKKSTVHGDSPVPQCTGSCSPGKCSGHSNTTNSTSSSSTGSMGCCQGGCGGRGGCTSSCMGGGGGMAMTFHMSQAELVLFDGWNTNTRTKYAMTCIALIVLCLIKEWLSVYRVRLVNNTLGAGMPLVNSKHSSSSTSPAAYDEVGPVGGQRNSARKLRLVSTLLYAVTLFLGYSVMLVLMTYNGGFFLCIILGSALGYGIFNWESKTNNVALMPEPECCEK